MQLQRYLGSFPRWSLILVIGIVGLVDVYFGSPLVGDQPAGAFGFILAVVVFLGLLVHPWGQDRALFAVCAALTLLIFVPNVAETVVIVPPVLYALYLAAAYATHRNRWLAWGIIGVVAAPLFGNTFVAIDSPSMAFAVVVPALFGIGFMWLAGLTRRRQQEVLVTLSERAELAAVLERTHIARELHDIVGHNLTSVIALADGARFAAQNDPQIAVDTLKTISESSREALQQVRGLVTLLREDPRPRLAPSSDGIAALISDAQAGGFRLHVTGEVPGDLSPAAGFVLFRSVQELLTNMIRHAETRSGSLLFEATPLAVKCLAENDCAQDWEKGSGLMGLEERVHAIGGSVRFQHADGRFITQVVIPR
ncbi:sensor histidine kinase [Corynebacterium sp.]|uniref:sensor histidine kinase n=1 Tax=Corynebacterium sp. TaxID=1720 RepID=UPI0026DAA9DB|nr:histidine kinase [Corynebacterium sp.]MDO5077963.1 histidine kinase [Corynebacterium sp.]